MINKIQLNGTESDAWTPEDWKSHEFEQLRLAAISHAHLPNNETNKTNAVYLRFILSLFVVSPYVRIAGNNVVSYVSESIRFDCFFFSADSIAIEWWFDHNGNDCTGKW